MFIYRCLVTMRRNLLKYCIRYLLKCSKYVFCISIITYYSNIHPIVIFYYFVLDYLY